MLDVTSFQPSELLALAAKGAPWAALSYVVYNAVMVVYNLHFHPLAKFPGPRWAAASGWWQVYVELLKQESLSKKLLDLHEEYGDVVRIAPNQLHFSRPSAYNEIYNVKNRWDRDMALYHIFADERSTLTIPDYTTAKKRRDLTTFLFSRKNIIAMQHLVQQCLDTACENIDTHIKEGKPVSIFKAFRCCAADVICTMCFARSMNATSEPGFNAPVVTSIHAAFPVIMVFKHFRLLQAIITKAPAALMRHLAPELGGLMQMRQMLTDQVKEAKANPQVLHDLQQVTIYHELLKDPENVPSDVSLRDEAVLYVTAGMDTSSDALTLGTVNILSRPELHAELLRELVAAWPNVDDAPPRYEQIEKLPYLTAVLKESLRMSHGVVQPMTRVVPKEGARISGYSIPGGSVVAISNIFVHWSKEIFADARAFKPERWLDPEADLDPWLVAFSKGPRSCLGVNLGWCELYMSMATLFRRYDMKLNGVGPSDLKWRDVYLPLHIGPDLTVIAKRRTV
ncbi:cytochrome P450 [Phanerochaete sordida]|uniref:Cytochrome P450 n=1 Tax=Phanerochaete sordida TaxID=48140 RepID=A0A9P3FXG6_9APHY|nr:cytochrome P450 [Phanerochaete sordida]